MAKEIKLENRWEDRNVALQIYRTSGSFGWLHLIIGQNKITKNKFLRLKRYMNWFSIPDAHYLSVVQKMLKEGAQRLSWTLKEDDTIKIEENPVGAVEDDLKKELENEEDLKAFIQEYPNFVKKIISLDLKSKDKKYLFDILQYIDEAINKSGERFKFAFKELLPKITSQDSKSMFELSDLMDKWNLFQITSLVNIVKNRIDTIETLEQMIHDEKTYEIKEDNSMHRILEKNMWIIDENYWIVQSNKSLRKFIGDELEKVDEKYKKRRPDFVCANKDNKIIILEIKRPSLTLSKAELDQAELYHRIIRKYKAKIGNIEVYLIGNKISTEAKEVAELRKGLMIKTYQDFLDDCKKRYQDYLKIVER